MRYLFVDNYRGFEATFIPIKDVNFLVGENSTGKSSILYLINLLGSPHFWYDEEFNTAEVELGVFKDIISANSDNKKFFRIGVVEYDDEAEFPSDQQNTFLITFVEGQGLPIIKDYNYVKHNQQIQIMFSRKLIKYKISEVEPLENLASTLLKTFENWLHKPIGSGRGYKTLRREELPVGRKGSLMFIKALLQNLAFEKSEDKVDIRSFLQPDIPTFAQQLAWFAPVRSKPTRIYGGFQRVYTPEGEHTPHLIKDLLSREKTAINFQNFTEKFGSESGLFESVHIKNFGKSFASPFELDVSIGGSRLPISNVGYGVSQSLPIIVELFVRSSGYHWFALQQPEVHLHPKAQAALGNLFLDMAIQSNTRFLIETHSDYIIDRFRTCYRENEAAQSITSQVLFFERYKCGNRIHNIPILKDGNYDDDQPANFREFFINEELRILGL